MKISIIIPIYNVEKYIERCVRSLLEQSLSDIEYIFVNDCTKDESMNIVHSLIAEYVNNFSDIKIVSHERNKGLAAARNSGLSVATGDYVFHCDADDWLEKNAMEEMLNAVKDGTVDLVWCDWYLSFHDNERYMCQEALDDPAEYMKEILSGRLKFNVWNKLVKRSLYIDNHIMFPEGYDMGEDMTMIKLCALARKVAYLPMALYHYMQLNVDSYTKRPSEARLLQILYNANNTISFLQSHSYNNLDEEIQFFKLNIKWPFLISDDKESYKRWLEWYPEANAYIDKNRKISFRVRLLQKAAARKCFWIVRLHYYLIIRVMYGIIYK